MAAGSAPSFKGGLPLFRFRGIRVFVHWSFLILPAWIAISGFMDELSAADILGRIGLVLIVFVCVVMHEFGHAITAQHYGVRTRDITLLPIGGVANLERMPEEPKQEFWITVAGPLVNLAIAAVAFVAIAIAGITVIFSDVMLGATTVTNVLMFVFSANLVLFLFNLVPAFPMDGGRILRSLLSMRMPREKATRIAASIGRFFAVAFVLYGLLDKQPFLALIGLFIFLAAGAESRMVQKQAALRGISVRQVMRTRFWSMPHTATVQQAVDELLAGGDHDLVLLRDGRYRGVLTRRDLVQAVSEQRLASPLHELPVQHVPAIGPAVELNAATLALLAGKYALIPVVDEDRVLGVLENENLAEFLLLREAARQGT